MGYVVRMDACILMKGHHMNLNLALKSTFAAVALAAAGYASAVTMAPAATPLSFGAPNIVEVTTDSFTNTFSFHVDTLSKFSAYMNSTSQLIAGVVQVQPLSFSAISLGGVSGLITTSATGSQGSISTTLGKGDYVLTIAGAASPIQSIFPVTGSYGTYSAYGNLAPVPEPESYAMFLAGLGIIGAVAGRRRKNI